jgi:rubrerythrin
MYPEFIKAAKAEKNNAALKSFHWANEVEKVHGELYQKAIEAVESGATVPEKDYYICKKCGYTVGDSAPDKCPVCGAKKDDFFIAD